MSKKYYLYVHNTMTGKTEKVAVSKEVYVCYKRTEWNIRANDRSFYKHEIQFSVLLSDMESLVEEVRNVVACDEMIDSAIEKKILIEKLNLIIESMSSADRELIDAIFEQGLTEREYALQKGLCRNAIHKRKMKILKRIKIKLDF